MCSVRICQLLLSISLLKACSSLECYTCSSQLDLMGMKNECDNFWYSDDEKYKRSHCPNIDSVCAKYLVEHDGTRWIHRSCQSPNICSQLSTKYNDNRNILLECDTCADENLCNAGSIKLASLFLLIESTIVFIAIFY